MAIVFFDYDGTLVDESAGILRPTKKTLESVERLQKNGHYVVLATGRAKCYVPDCGIRWDGMISSNGAYGEIAGKTVYDNKVSQELLYEIVNNAEELGYVYVLENQDVCYTNGFKNKHFRKTMELFDLTANAFQSIEKADVLRANKMFLTYATDNDFEILQKAFEGKFILGKHRSNNSCDCDVIGSSKGVGLKMVAESVNIPISETYFFGDGINDYTLMENVGHGVAMGQHVPELEKVCEFITGTVKEEGITTGLKHYRLL